jgi:hypothetical protein
MIYDKTPPRFHLISLIEVRMKKVMGARPFFTRREPRFPSIFWAFPPESFEVFRNAWALVSQAIRSLPESSRKLPKFSTGLLLGLPFVSADDLFVPEFRESTPEGSEHFWLGFQARAQQFNPALDIVGASA